MVAVDFGLDTVVVYTLDCRSGKLQAEAGRRGMVGTVRHAVPIFYYATRWLGNIFSMYAFMYFVADRPFSNPCALVASTP